MLLLALLGCLTAAGQNYYPEDGAFVCDNGTNRYTRALYGSHTDWRLETSDRPVFAVVKKGHHRNISFCVDGTPMDVLAHCRAWYSCGRRYYRLTDEARWGSGDKQVTVDVVAAPDSESAIWKFQATNFSPTLKAIVRPIAQPKLHRNGDIGADKPGVLEAAGDVLQQLEWTLDGSVYLLVDVDTLRLLGAGEGRQKFDAAVDHYAELGNRIQFVTPDPYINTLGWALTAAADGDWDGKTWLHGCIGWRMPLAGWRAAYVGDVLGWNDRQQSHFDAYAKSQVTNVEPTIPHPSQDPKMNLARAEKRWGTQMYSNGYICRNPERNDQMHHYDMNLNYIDELLWHFQYDADTAYMRKMWPVIKSHLAWEKRNYAPDGDHLYDAYCCIWASDALYYNGGAVTHSSAYNYRGNKLAARIAEIIGENPEPYRQEAEAILKAMNQRLWMGGKGVWAECQDAMGLKRLHESPAVWSVYTPIDCGACSPRQAYDATDWVMSHIPRILIPTPNPSQLGGEPKKTQGGNSVNGVTNLPSRTGGVGGGFTIATSNWMPYSWSINNVAAAEVMHTALAFFEAGHSSWGYELMMGNVMDQMYYGQCPGNFGQISKYDAARGECYRDFGDCIGISSRTLIQGLFGIIPQALDGQCIIRPGFPSSWDSVAIKTPYLSYKYTRRGGVERYEITQNFRQPLKIVVRQDLGLGSYHDTEGSSEQYQVIELQKPDVALRFRDPILVERPALGLDWQMKDDKMSSPLALDQLFNANVSDIFKNQYLSPRPLTTTLQIPVQGIGEWCHPEQTADINDSVFRSLIQKDNIVLAGIPFRTPKTGRNIIYTSLWDNYPDSVAIPVSGFVSNVANAQVAHLLLAGSTNHMQSRIDNGLVIATYDDGTTDTMPLRNPDNWCPIEQDYYVDGKAFYAAKPRPYRVCLNQTTSDGRPLVSRDLGQELGLQGAADRYIPGGAAQILSMPLNPQKKLRSLTLRTLSNDVVIGLMAITLQ